MNLAKRKREKWKWNILQPEFHSACINTRYNFNKQLAYSLKFSKLYKELSFLLLHTEREKKREKEKTVCNSCFCAPFFLFFFPPPSPRENDLFNRSESVVIEQFKRRANWSRFSDNGWPINNPGRGWFWVVVNLFPSMAVQEPGECQGQHSRYHWPPAITPEALSRVRLRSHIRRKRNGPTARYRYLSVDNVANLCCGTCTRAKYFHPHLDSQNFHGSRLLGSRVATIPFPINRNVHFSFLSFLFLLVSRAELPSKPCLFLSQGREKYKNLDIYFPRGNKAGSRSRVTTILRFSWKGNWFISRPKERISVCTSIEWRNRYFDSNVPAGIYFQPFKSYGRWERWP